MLVGKEREMERIKKNYIKHICYNINCVHTKSKNSKNILSVLKYNNDVEMVSMFTCKINQNHDWVQVDWLYGVNIH